MSCRCRSSGCASTASDTIRRRSRRCARARAKARCSTSRPTRFSSRLLLRNLRENLTVDESEQGMKLEFRPTAQIRRQAVREPMQIRAVETEQSNSTALVDEDYVVKIYRKLEPGINPEIEMGRFLTEVAGFANTPALLGSVELVEGEQRQRDRHRPRVCQNQGDAWTVTAAYLDRFVEEQRLLAPASDVRRKRRTGLLSALHVADRKTRCGDARRTGERRGYAGLHAGADHAGRCQHHGSTDVMASRRARLRWLAAAPQRLAGGRASLVDQLLARARDPARSPRARCCRATSTASTSAITAISISGRC